MAWDPDQYVKFADERERPYHELVARVAAKEPSSVLDVGCGPGTATASLLRRWPFAHVLGVDSSPEMIERSQSLEERNGTGGTLDFEVADAREVDVSRADVVVSNSALQWLPDHRELLRAWAAALRPGAWLAFQVPGNFDAPSHRLMREVAADGPWSDRLRGVLRGPETVDDPVEYAASLMDAGLSVDAWETTYIQWLTGPDPVLEWVKGTGLRPALTALAPDGEETVAAFVDAYRERVRAAYPARPGPDGVEVTALPFRRIFVVARKPEA